jgi:hypothetical protein
MSVGPSATAALAFYGVGRVQQFVDGAASPQQSVSAERPQRTAARFGRDVTVNVIANLVAGAIIYLAAAIAGLLPRSPYLIFLSAALAVFVLGIGLASLAALLPGRGGIYALCISLGFLGVLELAIPFMRLPALQVERLVLPISGIASIYLAWKWLRVAKQPYIVDKPLDSHPEA